MSENQKVKKQEGVDEEARLRVERILGGVIFRPGGGTAVGIVARFEEETVDTHAILTEEFAEFAGYKRLVIQVRSDEVGVEQYANPGKKKFGRTGEQWQKEGRVMLNGSWDFEAAIVADFLVQLMNLMGVSGFEEEYDFLSCFDEVTNEHYGRNFLRISQYRVHLLEWVAGRPRADNGGQTLHFN